MCFIDGISPDQSILAFGFPFGTEFTPFHGFLTNEDGPEGRWSANINFDSGTSGGPVFDDRRSRVIGLIKGGLVGTTDKTMTPITSVRYITPIIWLRSMLSNREVDQDCGTDDNLPVQGKHPLLEEPSLAEQEEPREELSNRLLNVVSLPKKPFAIDTLARRFEGQDPKFVGTCTMGGACYGAYRLEAGLIMDGFLNFLRFNQPTYAERLRRAGGGIAATAKTTEFIDEWKALSEAPQFTALQLKYIQATSFASLTARLKRPREAETVREQGLGLDVSARSLALQAVIFSIANQYGAYDSLPFDALRPLGDLEDKSDAQLIDAIFEFRDYISHYFRTIKDEKTIKLLKKRNEMERRDALFMLQNE